MFSKKFYLELSFLGQFLVKAFFNASMVRETPKQHRFQAIQNASIGNASA